MHANALADTALTSIFSRYLVNFVWVSAVMPAANALDTRIAQWVAEFSDSRKKLASGSKTIISVKKLLFGSWVPWRRGTACWTKLSQQIEFTTFGLGHFVALSTLGKMQNAAGLIIWKWCHDNTASITVNECILNLSCSFLTFKSLNVILGSALHVHFWGALTNSNDLWVFS